jgi:hypothetical protein
MNGKKTAEYRCCIGNLKEGEAMRGFPFPVFRHVQRTDIQNHHIRALDAK